MRLLYVASLDFYSNPNPSYHLMTTMIEDILAAGIEVDLIGCKEDGIKEHIPRVLETKENFFYELIDVPRIEKSNFVQRYFQGVKYSLQVRAVIKKKISQCDCVFVQSSPTVLYTLYFAKKIAKDKKVIYNIQDMFPGSSIASGVMTKKWMQYIFYRLQKVAYNKSDIITVISDDMKKKVIEQGVDPEKIKVIVNWFDDKSIREVRWEDNRFVKKYSMSKNKFYVQYAGTMGYVFDYKIVLDVAERLKWNKDIVFQMIGIGSQKEAFMSEAEQRKLDNIVFLPLERQEMVSDVYSACSVCYIPLKRGVIGNSVPSKAGLLMACKKTIITSADSSSDYCKKFAEFDMGIAKDPSDIDGVVQSILYLYNNREKCESMSINGFNYAKTIYSRSYNMQKYIKILNEIDSNK